MASEANMKNQVYSGLSGILEKQKNDYLLTNKASK